MNIFITLTKGKGKTVTINLSHIVSFDHYVGYDGENTEVNLSNNDCYYVKETIEEITKIVNTGIIS